MGPSLRALHVIDPATLEGALIYALAFLLLALFLSRMVHIVVDRALSRDSSIHIDRTRLRFLAQLAQVVIFVLALFGAAHFIPGLSQFGNAGLASVGVLSVIAGLAAQNTLGNLIAGISLLLYRPFNVGDRLQVAAPTGLETGVIENLTLGYTLIRTDDNRRVVVPNSLMASQTTINLTRDDPRILCSVSIPIDHDADIAQARGLLLDIARSNPKCQEAAGCPVTQLDAWGMVLTLNMWCADSAAAGALKCDVLEAVKLRFSAAGIRFPSLPRVLPVKN